ncbi:hypothetical protein HRbin16_00647 [bacterium HR16]|nr:hypothetical protein HRbin16_00647 [bacterium HR16]
MERLVNHLQQVATHHDLAQLHQWLCTYMLYAQTAVMPTVETVNIPAPSAREPVLKKIRWKGSHLLLPQRIIEEIPPRSLALLAVRNYMEASASKRRTVQSIFWTIVIIVVISPLVYIASERLPEEAHRWFFHLVVLVPIHMVWSWRARIAEQIERELLQRVGEVDTLLHALEAAIKLDIKTGVPGKLVDDTLARLNTLRREHGYPEISRDDLLPPLPPEDNEQKQPSSPAVDKGEFLRRHPPDEYNKVDKVRI